MDYLLHHLIRRGAERHGARVALRAGERDVTCADAWNAVQSLATGLAASGLTRGDRIAIQLPAGIEQALAIFAASAADGVAVPIHESLLARQVTHVLNDCAARCLITHSRAWRALATSGATIPSLRTVVLVDGNLDDASPAIDSPSPPHLIAWSDLVAREPGRERLERSVDKDLAAILYTSGSTGQPKGVMLSHANLWAGAEIVSDYLAITESDRLLVVLPLTFDAGLNQVTTTLLRGACAVFCPFLMAKQVVRSLQQERITGLAGVPTFWNLLTQSPAFQAASFPELRYVTNTGGALPLTTLARLRSSLSTTRIYLMYGLTEAFRSTYLPPEELDRRPTSMGRAIPNTEIFVVNEAGQVCAPGEVGELVHHGPTVSLGYWGQPEATAQVLRPHPFPPSGLGQPPLVCYSGDLVRQDEDGFLYFVGRRDNQLKSSGYRVSPTEIESVLYEHAGVSQAAVVGVPDPLLDQQIAAWIVAVDTVTAEQLRQHCEQRLPSYMVPRRFHLSAELPRTTSGKVDYATIRTRLNTLPE